MKILSVYSIKGGVGKTATSVNLAYNAAKAGKKVLVWDLDPQAAATFYFRIKPKISSNIKKAMAGKQSVESDVKATDFENIDMLPSDFSYRNLDVILNKEDSPEKCLRSVIKDVAGDYDLVVLDAPPGITVLSESIIRSANILLVPVIPTVLSLRTTEMLLVYLKENKAKRTAVSGFFTMADRRKKLHKDILEKGMQLGIKELETVIPYSSQVEQMGVNRTPVAEFSPRSSAAVGYRDLWNEIEAKYF